jgi:hypothetical protein
VAFVGVVGVAVDEVVDVLAGVDDGRVAAAWTVRMIRRTRVHHVRRGRPRAAGDS